MKKKSKQLFLSKLAMCFKVAALVLPVPLMFLSILMDWFLLFGISFIVFILVFDSSDTIRSF